MNAKRAAKLMQIAHYYGEEKQVCKLMEELGEATSAASEVLMLLSYHELGGKKRDLTARLEHLAGELADVVNVIPCMMPYVDAQFQPRKMTDRPNVVPEGSTNFAMISQFVEIPDDMVFTEEYSVRAARIAVYTLMDVDKAVCPVTPYVKDPKVLLKVVQTAYR